MRPFVVRDAWWVPREFPALPERDVEVLVSRDGVYHGSEGKRVSSVVPLQSLLTGRRGCYGAQLDLGACQEYRPPFAKKKGRAFWWVGGPARTPLHYDDYANALTVLRGRKRVSFCPFRAVANPAPAWMASANHAPEDASPRLSVTLNPRDVLYLPPGYWHAVDSEENTVAVSYWWTNASSGSQAYENRRDQVLAVRRSVRRRLRRSSTLDTTLRVAATAPKPRDRRRAARRFARSLQNDVKGTPPPVTPKVAAALWLMPDDDDTPALRRYDLDRLRNGRDRFFRQSFAIVMKQQRKRRLGTSCAHNNNNNNTSPRHLHKEQL